MRRQAVAIKKLVVSNATTFADILAGYDIAADSLNPDAQIGTVIVGVGDGDGTWESTNLVAGAESGADLRFGTTDDTVISSPDDVGGITLVNDRAWSSAARSIGLRRTVSATRYGIVAEQVATVIRRRNRVAFWWLECISCSSAGLAATRQSTSRIPKPRWEGWGH